MIDDLLFKVKNRQLVVVIVLLLGGVLLGWNVVVRPKLTAFSSVNAELGSLSQKGAPFGTIASLEKKNADYAQKLSKVGDKAWLIEQLNAIADKAKFPITSIAPDEKTLPVGSHLERIVVQIEADANYHQLGEFVSQVESLEQLVKISSVDIDRTSSDSVFGKAGTNFYKIRLSISLLNPAPGSLA